MFLMVLLESWLHQLELSSSISFTENIMVNYHVSVSRASCLKNSLDFRRHAYHFHIDIFKTNQAMTVGDKSLVNQWI